MTDLRGVNLDLTATGGLLLDGPLTDDQIEAARRDRARLIDAVLARDPLAGCTPAERHRLAGCGDFTRRAVAAARRLWGDISILSDDAGGGIPT